MKKFLRKLFKTEKHKVLNFMIPDVLDDKLNDHEYIVKFVIESMKEKMMLTSKIKQTNVQHIYVFEEDGEAFLCYRNEGDPADFYRGGFVFYLDEVDTSEKALLYFTQYKVAFEQMLNPYEGDTNHLLLEAINVEVYV